MKLSEGVLVSVITATAYLCSFAYERGMAEAFGFPAQLINLQLLPTLFTALVSLGLVAVFFKGATASLVDSLTPDRDAPPIGKALRVPIAILAGLTLIAGVGGTAFSKFGILPHLHLRGDWSRWRCRCCTIAGGNHSTTGSD